MSSKKFLFVVILTLIALVITLLGGDIHESVLEGNLKQTREILAKNPTLLNLKTEKGQTPLHLAAQEGHMEMIEFLVSQGAEINSKDSSGETPLLSAISHKHTEAARLLLSKGADDRIKDKRGMSAIVYAVFLGLNELVEPILDRGQDVNEDLEGGITLIHGAAILGNKELAELLIAREADINVKSDNGETPLYYAVFSGHADIAELFLNKGANFDFEEKRTSRTMLHLAALKGSKKMVSLLLDKGLEIDAKDSGGKTALQYAAKYGHKKIADLLIKKGAEAKNLEKNYGKSPLLNKKLKKSEAVIWYLGTSGLAIKTKNTFMIFDYHEERSQPDEPFLSNGHINPEEVQGQKVYTLVSHEHEDHYTPAIFEWRKTIKNVTYILGFKPEKASDYIFVNPRENRKIDDIEISTIKSTDLGVGFLVEVDGLTIFHAGDHANKDKELKGPYTEEIDFLAEKGIELDIAFLPIIGCGFPDVDAVKKGIYYTLEKLKPKALFPMHAGGREYLYKDFASEAEVKNSKVKIVCVENRGDRFFYSKGK